jgi:hypothetical protein
MLDWCEFTALKMKFLEKEDWDVQSNNVLSKFEYVLIDYLTSYELKMLSFRYVRIPLHFKYSL